jgi:hypothetical protein
MFVKTEVNPDIPAACFGFELGQKSPDLQPFMFGFGRTPSLGWVLTWGRMSASVMPIAGLIAAQAFQLILNLLSAA